MKLYHGTSETVARAALTDGLLPREDSGRESGWEECPSREDLVYLTVAYAGYFAAHAADEGERWAVIEVDTDLLPEGEDLMVPDEDFLEQATRNQLDDLVAAYPDFPATDDENGMVERTAWFREHLGMFGHLWESSLEGLGNCAHEGAIPPEAITRVVLFDSRANGFVGMAALDPFISIMNFRFCGRKYRALTRWLAGYEVAATEMLDLPDLDLDADPAKLPEGVAQMVTLFRQQRERAQESLDDRSGIEILFPEGGTP